MIFYLSPVEIYLRFLGYQRKVLIVSWQWAPFSAPFSRSATQSLPSNPLRTHIQNREHRTNICQNMIIRISVLGLCLASDKGKTYKEKSEILKNDQLTSKSLDIERYLWEEPLCESIDECKIHDGKR